MDYTDLYNFQTGVGIVVPTTEAVKAGIEDKFKDIFGAELDVTEETPVGRLIEAMTILVKSTCGVTAQNANQFNVNFATGAYLDSIAQIYGISRNVGKKTRCRIEIRVSSPTTIPAGSLVMNSETYDLFKILNDVTVTDIAGSYGIGTGTAEAVEYGPIPADAGTVTKIQTGVLGWIGVTNSAAYEIGSFEETDDDFRKRIIAARPSGSGLLTHLVASLKRVKGVNSACVLENSGLMDKVVKGVNIPGHSIYVCVDPVSSGADGNANSIAAAIAGFKPAGTGMVDVVSGGNPTRYAINIGTGAVNETYYFFSPEYDTISVKVVVSALSYSGSNLDADIESAVRSYVNGLEIGESVYATEMASVIMSKIKGVSCRSIEMTRATGATSLSEITEFGYQRAICGQVMVVV